MPLTAKITNISRTSLHDGPGVRTVVYFKGCNLRCAWCHNPETHAFSPELLYAPTKCICCGRCIALCPEHHSAGTDSAVFSREGCKSCGKCAQNCPSNALSLSHKEMTAEEVFAQIKKDLPYYRATGGGITLSGGECLLYPEFCTALLTLCKDAGISTLAESAFCLPWENVEKLLPFCDEFYGDFKMASSAKHKRFTGQGNELILENLTKLSSTAPDRLTVRTPLIPEVNDGNEDIILLGKALLPIASNLHGIELLRYNNLAASKYAQLSREYTDFGSPQTDEKMAELCVLLSNTVEARTKVSFRK